MGPSPCPFAAHNKSFKDTGRALSELDIDHLTTLSFEISHPHIPCSPIQVPTPPSRMRSPSVESVEAPRCRGWNRPWGQSHRPSPEVLGAERQRAAKQRRASARPRKRASASCGGRSDVRLRRPGHPKARVVKAGWLPVLEKGVCGELAEQPDNQTISLASQPQNTDVWSGGKAEISVCGFKSSKRSNSEKL